MSSSHEPQQENYYEMKGGFNQTQEPTDEKRGSVEIAEGAELYGDIQTAEHYGYVHRGLKSRHIQFIAVS